MVNSIEIKKLTYSNENGIHRISAEIDGELLWFESSDVALFPSSEGFAGIFLIHALKRKSNLIIDATLDKIWLSNISELIKIFGKWWGYPTISIVSSGGNVHKTKKDKATALCFTGGVDSFHTLLRSKYSIDYLVFVHGYDIALKDVEHVNLFRKSFYAIAEETRIKPLIIKTNLREHFIFSEVSWSKTHGGALAATGHFISNVDCLLISSSLPTFFDPPWGSHHKTDPLFSSENLKVVHEGASLSRSQKLREIVDEPLVRSHLRVCWQNRKSKLNCCECEKCIRNMIILVQCGKLNNFITFNQRSDLVNLCDKLPYFSDPDLIYSYKSFLRAGLEPQLARSVKDLLERSQKRIYEERIISYPVIGNQIKFLWLSIPSKIRKKIKQFFNL